MTDPNQIRLAIINSKKSKYSETFIQKHLDLLPFAIYHYYGFYPNFLNENSKALNRGLKKIINRALGYLTGEKYWDYHLSLAESLTNEKVEVILAEYATVAARSLPAFKRTGIPLIVHFHGYDISVERYLLAYNHYHELIAYASKFIVVSREMKKKALTLGIPENKIDLNPYGPDNEFLRLSPRFDNSNFMFVGRFTEKKAPDCTIRAFGKIVDEFPEARLHMVGKGDLWDECKELVQDMNLNSNVVFHGICKPADIMRLMEQSIALVQHSVTSSTGDMEGTPLAVLEAQAAALPVVSTFHAGIPDVVLNGKTGLLCEELDWGQMARNMRWILIHREEAKAMGKLGRERVLNNFSLDLHIDRLKKTILSVAIKGN